MLCLHVSVQTYPYKRALQHVLSRAKKQDNFQESRLSIPAETLPRLSVRIGVVLQEGGQSADWEIWTQTHPLRREVSSLDNVRFVAPQCAPATVLVARPSSNQAAQLEWPTNPCRFQLETTTALQAGSWSSNTLPILQTNGFKN